MCEIKLAVVWVLNIREESLWDTDNCWGNYWTQNMSPGAPPPPKRTLQREELNYLYRSLNIMWIVK